MIAGSTKKITDLVKHSLKSKPCWYVSCGGAAGSSFELALGRKVRREILLRNPNHSKDFRENEGEVNLLVWCSWRLRNSQRPIIGSENPSSTIQEHLNRLVSSCIEKVKVNGKTWDIELEFSNDLTLEIFCDNLNEDAAFDGNWELWLGDKVVSVGIGCEAQIEKRK